MHVKEEVKMEDSMVAGREVEEDDAKTTENSTAGQGAKQQVDPDHVVNTHDLVDGVIEIGPELLPDHLPVFSFQCPTLQYGSVLNLIIRKNRPASSKERQRLMKKKENSNR